MSQRPSNNPLRGLRYLLQGFQLVRQPGLRRYVYIPLGINTALFAALGWLAVSWIGQFVQEQVDKLPDWLQWLDWLIWILLGLALLVLGFSLFTFLANLIAAPFNGLLAEAVERRLTGRVTSDDGHWSQALKEIPVAVGEELGKLLYFGAWAIPFLILFLIPGVNFIASPLWVIFSAWMLSLEYADYPMGNHGIRFRNQRQQLGERRFLVLGFGGGVLAATMIPIVNFLIIPVAVAGATALWVQEFEGGGTSIDNPTGTEN